MAHARSFFLHKFAIISNFATYLNHQKTVAFFISIMKGDIGHIFIIYIWLKSYV